MAHRLKWLLILALAIAQFGMVGVTPAFAKSAVSLTGKVAMANCSGAGHCCDFGAPDHCSACVSCVSYNGPAIHSIEVAFQQVHEDVKVPTLFAFVWAIEPPPPRG